MRYSLADYKFSITIPENMKAVFNMNEITIGGQGDYHDSISVSVNGTLWSLSTYKTGAYVYNKDLDRTGSISVNLNQLSVAVSQFIKLCNIYYTNSAYDNEPITITVMNGDTQKVCTCSDCKIKSIPNQDFKDTASDQTWKFLAGKVTFE